MGDLLMRFRVSACGRVQGEPEWREDRMAAETVGSG